MRKSRRKELKSPTITTTTSHQFLAIFFKGREDKEFVVDSGASIHMVSKEDLNSAELEIVRISRNPTTVLTANGEVQTQRISHGKCHRIGIIRDGDASSKYSRSSFFRETQPLEQQSKTTTHQKGQEN